MIGRVSVLIIVAGYSLRAYWHVIHITVAELLIAVEDFDNFTADNDPYAEHDFGAINLR